MAGTGTEYGICCGVGVGVGVGVQFKFWLEEAVGDGVPEPNAMALSTVDANGSP